MGPRGIAFKEIIPKRPEGRPTVMTPTTVQKLEDAFSYGMSDERACAYAGISKQTLYNYQKEHPEFIDRKQMLKLTPDLRAQKTLVANLDNEASARWWAEHKMTDEFANKSKVEMSGEVITHTPMTPELAAGIAKANEALREAVAAPHKQV